MSQLVIALSFIKLLAFYSYFFLRDFKYRYIRKFYFYIQDEIFRAFYSFTKFLSGNANVTIIKFIHDHEAEIKIRIKVVQFLPLEAF